MACKFGGNIRTLCKNTSCEYCYKKSFASHEKSKCWSKKNNISPRDVFQQGTKEYYFLCNNCNHEFYTKVCNICNGQWCPYCSNPPKNRDRETGAAREKPPAARASRFRSRR